MKLITSITAVLLFVTTSVLAHTMMLKGTVAALETKRIQLKTGEEKKGEAPVWFEITPRTKILREKTTLTLEQARITVGERAVLIIDHGADGVMKVTEIRLAAR